MTLYGTTYAGGSLGLGVVFELGTSGTGYKVLHSFTGGDSDGANPFAGVILGAGTPSSTIVPDGNGGKGQCTGACGVAVSGGRGDFGVVFEISQ